MTVQQVAAILGVTPGRINGWEATYDVVRPRVVRQSRRPGRPTHYREYEPWHVAKLRAFMRLQAAGYTRAQAARMADAAVVLRWGSTQLSKGSIEG